MRLIGKLESERMARRLSDYLLAAGIENQADPGSSGDWEIWVVEDAKVKDATNAFARFAENPKSKEFDASGEAARIRAQAERDSRQPKGKVIDVRTQRHIDATTFKAPVTAGLIAISVLVAFGSNLGANSVFLKPLMIVPLRAELLRTDRLPILLNLMLQGEVWRPITPIFIHFGIMHIVFNMLWMVDLGRMIEPKRGSLYMAFIVLLFAIPSNILQYWAGGQEFGGMSGVVFGLIGYMWIYNKCSYRDTYPLDQRTVTLSLAWFVICILGLFGPIANWAHGGGLAVGMLWGFLRSDRFKRMIKL